MDDRGEGATFEDVPDLIEVEQSALLDDALDVTAIALVPGKKSSIEDELDETVVVATTDRSALIDELDTTVVVATKDRSALIDELDTTVVVATTDRSALIEGLDTTVAVATTDRNDLIDELDTTVVAGTDAETFLDSTLDETVVVMEDVSGFISEHTQSFDELDSTVVSFEQGDDSNVQLSGLVGLIEPVEAVHQVEGAFDRFENDAPAPPPVCTVIGAGVPSAEAQRLAPGPRWIEKDARTRPSAASRGFKSLFFLIASAAAAYGFYHYQHSGEGGQSASLAQEVVPPKGQDLVLAPAQVRYCMAQGIRLGSAAEQAVGLSAAASARLRMVFNDFDQRCADYKFESGSLLAAQQGVEADRTILEQEGLSLLASIKRINDPVSSELVKPVAHSKTPVEAPVLADAQVVFVKEASTSIDMAELVPNPQELLVASVEPAKPVVVAAVESFVPEIQEPRRIIKDMQWRLFKLGLFKGSMSGVYGESTQLAVKEFFRSHSDIAESQVESEIYRAVDGVYVKRQ